ncbi:PorV/PorQ family protein [Rubrivirga sp.]|uniref:PorV/PorQ family protein n=1 Tax=Rubrivirga sp. TaxID=1885344 RepID=UPI003B51DD50
MTRTLFLAALVAAAAPLGAQTKTGTTFGQFLLIEPSASVAAQGNVGATARADVLSAYYNPGALGFQRESNAGFSHSSWLADIDYNYAAVALKMGSASTVSLSVASLSSGDIDVRTAEQPLGTGERYSVEDLAIGIGYGRQFTDRFGAGATVKFVQETIWRSSAQTVALDAGVIYELPFRAVLGASISNFGVPASFDGTDLRIRFDQDPDTFGDNDNLPAALETDEFALPVFFRVGMSVPVQVGDSRLTLAADAYQPSDNSNSLSVGGEWTYANLISARAGYQDLFLEDGEGGLRVGGGLAYRVSGFDFRFDYAWADHGSRLGSTQRFTLGLGF